MDPNWLDDFATFTDPPAPRRRPLATLSGFVAVAAAVGLLVSLLAMPIVLPAGVAAREAARYYLSLPSRLQEPPLPQKSVILAADGSKIATLFAYDRTPVPGDEMSAAIRQAVVDTEDARFYREGGVDPIGIVRAAVNDVAGGGDLEGASTLTQQYVKNVLVLQAQLGSTATAAVNGRAVSVLRKLREVRLASHLDKTMSKADLLTKYLNIAYFGNGAYGIEAAARRYFSTDASDLSVAQAATLVPLLKNPTAFDPLRYPQVARVRRAIVLDRMVAMGHLSAQQAAAVKAQPLGLHPSVPQHGCLVSKYPFYCQQVVNELTSDPAFGKTQAARDRLLAVGGLTIRTPMSRKAMRLATAAAKSTIPTRYPVATGITVVQPGTGHVVAIGTNRNYGVHGRGETELVLPTVPAFQSGSTFKLFTLAAALDKGFPLSTTVPGGATYTSHKMNNPPQGFYSNSDGSLTNPDLTTAMEMSMNTAFVELEEKVGVRAVAEMANRLGVKTVAYHGPGAPSPRDGSFTLGTAPVSTTEMADAYATIAAGGVYCPPVFITSVTDAAGTKLATPPTGCHRVLDRAAADTASYVLQQVVNHGTGTPAYFGRPAAGKTGTTENYGAAWFVGFTPQYSAAVWVGDPRGGATHPLYNILGYSRVFGDTLPATVWRKTMEGLHRGLPVKPLPGPDPSYVTTTAGQLLPSVVGLPVAAARQRLRSAGARAQVSYRRPGDGQAAGVVVAQSPDAGVRAAGQTVTLTVTR